MVSAEIRRWKNTIARMHYLVPFFVSTSQFPYIWSLFEMPRVEGMTENTWTYTNPLPCQKDTVITPLFRGVQQLFHQHKFVFWTVFPTLLGIVAKCFKRLPRNSDSWYMFQWHSKKKNPNSVIWGVTASFKNSKCGLFSPFSNPVK